MKFAILMSEGGGAWERLSAAEQADVMERHAALQRALEEQGRYVASYRLAPSREARTVRRDVRGSFSVTDGPFAEAKEIMGGLYLIEADSLEEAVEWAKRSRFISGANEVRQVID